MPGTLSDLCENEDVKRVIMDDMSVWAKETGLRPFEQVNSMNLLELATYDVNFFRVREGVYSSKCNKKLKCDRITKRSHR